MLAFYTQRRSSPRNHSRRKQWTYSIHGCCVHDRQRRLDVRSPVFYHDCQLHFRLLLIQMRTDPICRASTRRRSGATNVCVWHDSPMGCVFGYEFGCDKRSSSHRVEIGTMSFDRQFHGYDWRSGHTESELSCACMSGMLTYIFNAQVSLYCVYLTIDWGVTRVLTWWLSCTSTSLWLIWICRTIKSKMTVHSLSPLSLLSASVSSLSFFLSICVSLFCFALLDIFISFFDYGLRHSRDCSLRKISLAHILSMHRGCRVVWFRPRVCVTDHTQRGQQFDWNGWRCEICQCHWHITSHSDYQSLKVRCSSPLSVR